MLLYCYVVVTVAMLVEKENEINFYMNFDSFFYYLKSVSSNTNFRLSSFNSVILTVG